MKILNKNGLPYSLRVLFAAGVVILPGRGGGDSHMKQMGMLVGNFEFKP